MLGAARSYSTHRISGRSMLMALVAGTTDPALLADLARGQLSKKLPELRQALTGRFGPHHRFMVSRLLADIDYVEEASAELSRRIEELLAPFAAAVERLVTIPGVQRRHRRSDGGRNWRRHEPLPQRRASLELGRHVSRQS